MIKSLQTRGGLTWRFKGSTYTVTPEKGSFNETREACARYGMYLWTPDSQEEAEFVYQTILNNLNSSYYHITTDGNRVYKYLYIGVIDRPNDNCLLVDFETPCPIKNYGPGEPSQGHEECTTMLKKKGTFMWNDIPCNKQRYGLCEGN